MDETQEENSVDSMYDFSKKNDQYIIDRDDQTVKLRNIDIDKEQFGFGLALSKLQPNMDNKESVINTLLSINAKILKLDSSPDSKYYDNDKIIQKIRAGVNFRTTKEQIDFSVKYHNDSNADNPRFTTLDVAKDFTDGNLSFEDFKTFTKTYGAIQDDDFTAALKLARTKMNIPDVTLFNGTGLKEANYNMYNVYKNNMILAKLNTPQDQVFDPQKYNEDFLEDFVKTELSRTMGEKYADLYVLKFSGTFGANTKQLNRFIEQCSGKPEFADRCESLIEFKRKVIEYNASPEGLQKPLDGYEGLSFN